MFEIASGRPRHCLKIGPHSLVWADCSRTWRGRYRYRCVISPVPAGSIKLSPIDLNLADRPVIEERLRSLVGPARSVQFSGRVLLPDLPRSMTLLLPDLTVRATIVAFDRLPPQQDEIEALIRWRLGQEQRLPLAGAKLIWQVFPSAQSGANSQTVLVISIQESILGQYESLCESVGLLPQEVGMTSFHLFNLWLKAAGRKRLERDLAWLTVLDGTLTCFIFHHGRPVFVRTKLLTGESSHSSTDDHGREDSILHETAASLHACQELHPDVHVEEMVVMTDDGLLHLDEALSHEAGIKVDRLVWHHVHALGWNHGGGSTSMTALPAVAGMM